MYTDALWSTMFSIILLLTLTIFFKAVIFRWIYDAGSLTTPQVFVDWRLWTMDVWFWYLLGSLVLLSIVLNLISRCCERGCERKRYEQTCVQSQDLNRLKKLDLATGV